MPGNDAIPAVSVVIPLYNKAPYVHRAISSVLDQSFEDLEVIVVDDGSTDAGGEIVAAIQDPRLRLIRQANAGVAAARNVGVGASRGRWVAFLDADDTWRPDRLARQFAALAGAPDVVWAAGAFFTTKDGRALPIADAPEAWFAAADVLKDALLMLGAGWMLWTGTVMVRRDVFAQLGGFDPVLKVGEDVFLWARLAVQHPRLVYVRTPIATYSLDIGHSLTKRAAAAGILDQLELARRLIALARTLPAERAALLHRQARRIILRQAKNHLAHGRFRAFGAALEVGSSLELGRAGRWLRMGRELPSNPIARGLGWPIRLRRRLRNATEKPCVRRPQTAAPSRRKPGLITARSAIKSAALAALPVLNALGINAKRGYELAYWWSRKLQEGKLGNKHYSWLMTAPFQLEAEAYRGKRVLDVGCGPRGSLEWCAVAAERVGLDPLADGYRKLGVDRHAMTYCCAPAEAIPFADEHFDVVICINALDHVDDVERAIAEMSRVLAPGGLLLLIVEIHPRPTIAEPHALPWSLTSRFPLTVIEERHLERSDGSLRYLEHEVPFDHAAPPHAGMLVAKLMKPGSSRRPDPARPMPSSS